MQLFYHRLTKHARKVINTSLGDRKLDVKKINAYFLIQAIEKEKGSLGKLIIENLSLREKIEKNKEKVEITIFDVLVKSFKLASAGGGLYIGTEHLVQGFLFALIEKQEKLYNKILVPKKLESIGKKNDALSNFSGRSLPPEFFGEINSMINNFLSSGNQKISGEENFLKSF